MSKVTTARDGEVLIVTSDNPPVNALGAAVRQGLADAMAEAKTDPSIKAVVVRGAGRTFFAGADITEFGRPMTGPALPEVIDAMEGSSVPVVAAIHGTALGGGLEVALGAHYRVAVPSAKLGLPEVELGLLPGAGGTQRLPRVVGVEAALPMIVMGDPVPAKRALEMGLIDRIVSEDKLVEEAVAFAREVAAKGGNHPKASERTDKIGGTDQSVFNQFRQTNARRIRGFDAPEACIKTVEAAATLPFAEGIARERELFMGLMTGDQSRAQRHLFFAERAANKIDDLPADTQLLPIKKVGILGAGTMGGGIAMNFLSAGIPVVILEREQGPLDKGVGIIRRNYENTAKKGRLTPEKVEQAMGMLSHTLDYGDLADCDLVIEAVFELMEIKKEVFAKLDAVVKPGAILASNTSYLDIDDIARATARPESVVGMHFFSPANVMKLLEVVRGARTSPAVLATVMALAKKINKVAVVSGVCHGFIGNRMLAKRQEQANAMLMEGAMPWDIDRVMTEFGMPMGPFQMADLAGLDIGYSEAKRTGSLRDVLVESGRRGQKTGKGFYDYDEKRTATPSDEVAGHIRSFAEKSGKPQRTIDDKEILERLLYPMVNEGALILEEGIAQRASDIDVVWVYGYGWPVYRGGPMFWADTVGLENVVASLAAHRELLGPNFKLSKLLADKAEKGQRFNG